MWELIRANKLKSYALIAAMLLVLLAIGTAIAGYASPEHYYLGAAAALGLWTVLFLAAYFKGDAILLGASGARPIDHQAAPRLFNVVEEMQIAAGLPVLPRIYVIEDEALNAFAVGRRPESSSVAITSGLIKRLSRDELQGVMAHELSHVVNRDSLYMTVAGVMLGAVALLSEGFLRGLFRGGRHGRRSGGSRGGGQAQFVFLALALVLAVLGPIMARLLYLALSRRREYLADASAAMLSRYPEGLAAALEKIGRDDRQLVRVSRATAPLFIANPLRGKGALTGLSSSHPPIQKRIAILRAMAGGAGLADYEQAWRRVTGEPGGLVPAGSLAGARPVAVRPPAAGEEEPDGALRREVGDMLRAGAGYAFIDCPCGVRIKVPPRLQQDRLYCPRCGAPHQLAAARPAPSGG